MKIIFLSILFITNLFSNNGKGQIFDPYTGELIKKDSISVKKYNPYNGELINQDSIKANNYNSYQLERFIESKNKHNNQIKFNHCIHSLYLSPTLSTTIRNHKFEIIATEGFSPFILGYYKKTFYKALKTNSWNFFWHWGTVGLFFPYVGIGTDYIKDSGFFWGVGTFYHIPIIFSIGKYF